MDMWARCRRPPGVVGSARYHEWIGISEGVASGFQQWDLVSTNTKHFKSWPGFASQILQQNNQISNNSEHDPVLDGNGTADVPGNEWKTSKCSPRYPEGTVLSDTEEL